MLAMDRTKAGGWQTVKSKSEEKKKKAAETKGAATDAKKATDRLGVAVEPQASAFAAFDRAYANKATAAAQQAAAAAAAAAAERASYQGAFSGLADEAPPAALRGDDDSGDESAAGAKASAAPAKQPKQPKAPKKPKLTVAQVAADVDVAALQSWMAEVQARYATNETAQLEALSDRLLALFKEATLDLGKLLATKGLNSASAQPLCDVPHALMNALASFVASAGEPAAAQVLVPLTLAVVNDAAGGPGGSAPAGKGKAGLHVMLAAVLRTRPQALVQVAGELRNAGRQLSGSGRLPALLWVVNQAAQADPAVGVAAWVRLLLPQLLGLPELPGAGGKAAKPVPAALADDILRPLEAPLQGPAVAYLEDLLQALGVTGGKPGAAVRGGDVTRGDGQVEPTVPGSAVESLSRLVAGKAAPATPAASGGGAAAAAAAAAEGKKSAAARAAALSALAPLLPGLTVLAGATSAEQQYTEWLLLALESAGLSSAEPDTPDALVQRSAASVVACICGSDALLPAVGDQAQGAAARQRARSGGAGAAAGTAAAHQGAARSGQRHARPARRAARAPPQPPGRRQGLAGRMRPRGRGRLQAAAAQARPRRQGRGQGWRRRRRRRLGRRVCHTARRRRRARRPRSDGGPAPPRGRRHRAGLCRRRRRRAARRAGARAARGRRAAGGGRRRALLGAGAGGARPVPGTGPGRGGTRAGAAPRGGRARARPGRAARGRRGGPATGGAGAGQERLSRARSGGGGGGGGGAACAGVGGLFLRGPDQAGERPGAASAPASHEGGGTSSCSVRPQAGRRRWRRRARGRGRHGASALRGQNVVWHPLC